MKSNKNGVEPSKLTKTAKAALPFFALFGGQGFASSRNPLSMQSSRKLAGKSVVFINEVEAPAIPVLAAKENQTVKSPFAAFTNKAVTKTKNAQINIESKAMDFLSNNNLLSATETKLSVLSGNINNRKTFSDDWQWSTRLANSAPFSTNSVAYSTCQASASYSGAMGFFQWQYNQSVYQSYTCFAVNTAGTAANFLTYNASAGAILGVCQAIHQACDGQPLPVDLMNFEVD